MEKTLLSSHLYQRFQLHHRIQSKRNNSIKNYIKILKKYDIKEVVTTCASCEKSLKDYIKWMKNSNIPEEDIEFLRKDLFDIDEYHNEGGKEKKNWHVLTLRKKVK